MSRTTILAMGVAVATILAGFSASAQTKQQPTDRQPSNQQSTSQKQTPGSAPSAISKSDQRFVTEAIQTDLAEVEIGKLAQQKSDNPDAKQFGQMLEQDHSQHLQQAKQLAQQIGVTPPSEPKPEQKAIYDKLSKLSGPSFDKQFAAAMVKAHKEDIVKFQKVAKEKPPVGEFASQTVPILQKHLQTAEALATTRQSKK
jgi:putative membrane protein